MKPTDFELRLNRNLAMAEREAGPLEITRCDCPGGYGTQTTCHIEIASPEHLAAVVAALLRAGVTGVDRLGFSQNGQFMHVDVENQRGRRRAWILGSKAPDGADALFSDDKERFRCLKREVARHGKRSWSLEIADSKITVDGITTGRRTSPREPDPFFKRRQARAAAGAARRAAIEEYAASKGIALAEAEKILSGKAA